MRRSWKAICMALVFALVGMGFAVAMPMAIQALADRALGPRGAEATSPDGEPSPITTPAGPILPGGALSGIDGEAGQDPDGRGHERGSEIKEGKNGGRPEAGARGERGSKSGAGDGGPGGRGSKVKGGGQQPAGPPHGGPNATDTDKEPGQGEEAASGKGPKGKGPKDKGLKDKGPKDGGPSHTGSPGPPDSGDKEPKKEKKPTSTKGASDKGKQDDDDEDSSGSDSDDKDSHGH
jgi:hypothetical protein